MKLNHLAIFASAFIALAASSNAATVVPISDITGHNGGQGFGFPVGNLPNVIDGSGMNQPSPNDPSTWTAANNNWQNEWQSSSLLSGATNGKIGWIAVDLGSAISGLQELYIWNERENGGRITDAYNIYYAVTPTIALPAQPGQQATAADVGFGAGDYDFSSAGWTQLGGTSNMSWRGDPGEATSVNDIVSLGGIEAQYIAIEMLSNGGDANRVGIAELAVAVPEPSTTALLGLGGFALLLRRRR